MRGSKWDLIKPLLKTLQEAFPAEIHVALIIKPDNFWQKQKTNFGSSKFIFEVSHTSLLTPLFLSHSATCMFLTCTSLSLDTHGWDWYFRIPGLLQPSQFGSGEE